MKTFLEPLTPEAEASLHGARLQLTHFPFRVGRECRMVMGSHGLRLMERRKDGVAPNNDLYLLDNGRPLNVSRAHFQLEQADDGTFILRDRGSALGTYVGGSLVGGGDRGGAQVIQSGDVIVAGTTESPFVFRFLVTD